MVQATGSVQGWHAPAHPGPGHAEADLDVVSKADLMFFISSHTCSQVTAGWQIPRSGTPVIQLDIDPSQLRRSYPIRVGLQGNAKAALRKMRRQNDESGLPACSAGPRLA